MHINIKLDKASAKMLVYLKSCSKHPLELLWWKVVIGSCKAGMPSTKRSRRVILVLLEEPLKSTKGRMAPVSLRVYGALQNFNAAPQI